MTETPVPYNAGGPVIGPGSKVVHQVTKEEGTVLEVILVNVGTDVTEGLLVDQGGGRRKVWLSYETTILNTGYPKPST